MYGAVSWHNPCPKADRRMSRSGPVEHFPSSGPCRVGIPFREVEQGDGSCWQVLYPLVHESGWGKGQDGLGESQTSRHYFG